MSAPGSISYMRSNVTYIVITPSSQRKKSNASSECYVDRPNPFISLIDQCPEHNVERQLKCTENCWVPLKPQLHGIERARLRSGRAEIAPDVWLGKGQVQL